MLLCRPLESAVFMSCSAQRTRSPVFVCGGWAAMAESPHLPNAAFTILLLCLKEQLVTRGHLTGGSRLTCWSQPVQSSCPLLSVTALFLLGLTSYCWVLTSDYDCVLLQQLNTYLAACRSFLFPEAHRVRLKPQSAHACLSPIKYLIFLVCWQNRDNTSGKHLSTNHSKMG